MNASYTCGSHRRKEVGVDASVYVTNAVFLHSDGCYGTLKGVKRVAPEGMEFKGKAMSKKQKEEAKEKEATQDELDIIDGNGMKNYPQIVNHLRPLARVLANHPQQKVYLDQLECIYNLAKGQTGNGDDTAAPASASTTSGAASAPSTNAAADGDDS